MRTVIFLLSFVATVAVTSPNFVTIFAQSVPDEILAADQITNVADFEDTSEIRCTELEGQRQQDCIEGRKKVLGYKQKYPNVYLICNEQHGGTEFVATCMMSWIDDQHWISSSKISSDQNLVIRGCLKNEGADYKKVYECYKSYGF